MSRDSVIGWDIGGAHLKAVCVDQSGELRWARQVPCPLWRGLGYLRRAMADIMADATADRLVAHGVTMTGELVDLFADREEGVRKIVEVTQSTLGRDPVRFYAAGAGLVDAGTAMRLSDRVASANWCASAGWAARRVGAGLLLDIGSTTTDIVPFADGALRNAGRDDFGRMQAEELIYTGVTRTPVCSLTERVPFEGQWLTLAAEHFSTTADVHRLTGLLPEDADQQPTPDGASRSLEHSARRLARMIGRDLNSSSMDRWRELAVYLADEQLIRILRGCRRVLSRGDVPGNGPVIGAGVGRFLAERIAAHLGRPYRDFDQLCPAGSAALAGRAADFAPAAAIANLVRGESPTEVSCAL